MARVVVASGLFWGCHLGCRPQRCARGEMGPWFRRSHCGFVRIPLHFDIVDSSEFRCISIFPLRFRTNSVVFRCSHYGSARILASSGLFWGGGHLDCRPQRPRAMGRDFVMFRCSHGGFVRIPLHFDVLAGPREFRPLVAYSDLSGMVI